MYDKITLMSRKLLLLLWVCALVAVACGGGDDQAAPEEPNTPTTSVAQEPADTSRPQPPDEPALPSTIPNNDLLQGTTATTVTAVDTTLAAATTSLPDLPLSPITGLPVEDEARLNRKVIAVKTDNHWDARPQSGIGEGEGVIEIMVEAGITRFLTLFHHSDTEWVGPVRSGRPTDWTVVRPLNGAMAISGAQPWVTRLITRNGVPLIGDLGPPLSNRWSSRSAPHNLYMNTFEARRVAEDRQLDQTPPEPLFNWGPINAGIASIATHILFNWSDTTDVTWTWDGEKYLRFIDSNPHEWHQLQDDTLEQISADTLVVLMARRYRACPSGNGSCVPAWETVGSNRALVFASGRHVEGTWQREDETEWFTLLDESGQEISLPPGRPWIMIFPQTATIEW